MDEILKKSLGGCKNINSFVSRKLADFGELPKTFEGLFSFMFSESENIMFEEGAGENFKNVTYGEVKAQALSFAAYLRSLNLKGGSAIGIYLDNGSKWIKAFWGILAAGFNPLLLNMRHTKEMNEKTLSAVNAVAVVTESEEFSCISISPYADKNQKTSDNGAIAGDNAFGKEFYVVSSGTSGSVKVCAYTAEETFAQVKNSYHIIGSVARVKKHYEGRLKLLTFLPFYHIFGFTAVYLWFGFFSRTFVTLPDMKPNTILETIRFHKVTHLFSVPLFWEKVRLEAEKKIKQSGDELYNKFQKGLKISNALCPSLRFAFAKKVFKEVRSKLFGESVIFCISGGSAISKETLAFFNGLGYHLANGYGMSEIGVTSVELSMKTKLLNSASVGKSLPTVEYRINEKGELEVKNSAASKYILENGERRAVAGEWFNTLDLAEKRGSRYYILGRADDLIVSSSGENLNPDIIEERFRSITHQIYLIPAKGGAAILAQVPRFSTKSGATATRDKIKETVFASGLSGEIKEIVLTYDDLLGDYIKPNRRKLKTLYESGKIHVIVPEEMSEAGGELYDKVKVIFLSAVEKPDAAVTVDTDFFTELGGSSLDYFVLISKLNEAFEIELPAEENLNTIGKIVEKIEKTL